MLQYVNSFTCAANTKKDSVVIHFRQNVPLVDSSPDEDGNFPEEMHQVASLIMDSNCATALLGILGDLLAKPSDSNE